MTPPAKWLPDSVTQFSSVKYFKDQVQAQVDEVSAQQGKTTTQVDLGQIQIVDEKQGDDYFRLVYQNEALDLGLEGLVQTNRHELSLWKYQGGSQEPTAIGYLEMEDACSLTRTLTGEGNVSASCKDGVVNANLVDGAAKYPTLQTFDQYCRDSYQNYLAKNPDLQRTGSYDLKRIQVLNPEKENFTFDLLYENPANAFYCRGHVQAKGLHHFFMTSGDRREYAWNPEVLYSKEGFYSNAMEGSEELIHGYEMIDGCRMTTALVGEKEFLGQCVEWTEGERRGVRITGYTFAGVQLVGLGIFAYDMLGGATWLADKIFKTQFHPASFGKWGSPSLWINKKFWGGVAWPFKQAANVWRALPALMNGARLALAGVASTGGTVAASTTTVATAGVATATATTAATTASVATAATATTSTTAAVGAGSSSVLATLGLTGIGGVSLTGLTGALLPGFLLGLPLGYGIVKTGVGRYIGLEAAGNYLGNVASNLLGPADKSTLDWCDKYLGWLL